MLRGLGLDRDSVGLERELNKSSTLPKSPILLIQWLDPDEDQEIINISQEFSQRTDIASVSTGDGEHGKNAVHAAILEWALDNKNCQFLYLSTHGDEHGIGPQNDPGITWSDLWNWLTEAHLSNIELWIGACKDSSVIDGWSELVAVAANSPVGAVVAFEDSLNTNDLEQFVSNLLEQIISLNGAALNLKASVQLAAAVIPNKKPQAFLCERETDGKGGFVEQE